MKNLAGQGHKLTDETIQEELYIAGIDMINGVKNSGEVPYTITGKLENWTLSRAWYYWIAQAEEGKGLLLDVAKMLNERAYPITGERQPKTFGEVVRVGGYAGGISPDRYGALHYDETGNRLIVDPEGKLEQLAKKLTPSNTLYVPSLEGVVAKSVVETYHIDNQVGLNEFAKVVRENS